MFSGSTSHTLTPTNDTLPAYRCWSSVRCGMLARHGPHQVAQNSTTVTLPFSKLVTGVPLIHFSTVIGGAGSPTRSAYGRSAASPPPGTTRVVAMPGKGAANDGEGVPIDPRGRSQGSGGGPRSASVVNQASMGASFGVRRPLFPGGF